MDKTQETNQVSAPEAVVKLGSIKLVNIYI